MLIKKRSFLKSYISRPDRVICALRRVTATWTWWNCCAGTAATNKLLVEKMLNTSL
jgi:hypothetical protein